MEAFARSAFTTFTSGFGRAGRLAALVSGRGRGPV